MTAPACSPALRIIVYGDALLVPETRPGWPELLTGVLSARRMWISGPVVNAGRRGSASFADVVRALTADRQRLDGTVAVVALSHADGRSDRLAPQDAALFAVQAVQYLLGQGAERVVVVGPTGGTPTGKRPAVGYGSYPRWLRRTEKAVREALGDVATYVSLADLPADLTRDGIRPLPAGWRWVAERVADALVRGGP